MSHRVRYKGHKIPLFDYIHIRKKEINLLLPEIDDNQISKMLHHIKRFEKNDYYYGRYTNDPEERKKKKDKPLTKAEMILFEYLHKNGISASTLYRQFLACRLPDDLKKQLERGEVSQKIAMRTLYNRKRQRYSNHGVLILTEMREILRGLNYD